MSGTLCGFYLFRKPLCVSLFVFTHLVRISCPENTVISQLSFRVFPMILHSSFILARLTMNIETTLTSIRLVKFANRLNLIASTAYSFYRNRFVCKLSLLTIRTCLCHAWLTDIFKPIATRGTPSCKILNMLYFSTIRALLKAYTILYWLCLSSSVFSHIFLHKK